MTAEPSPAKTSALRLLILAPSSDPTATPPFHSLLEGITGARPSEDVVSFAGYTSHPPVKLRTKYYSSDVHIWCDEVPASEDPAEQIQDPKEPASHGTSLSTSGENEDPVKDDAEDADEAGTPTLAEWREQMLSPAASDVRAVIGGIILLLPISSPPSSSLLESYAALVEAIQALRDALEDEGYGREVASIVVFQSTSTRVRQDKLNEAMDQFEERCLTDRGFLGWDYVAWDGEVHPQESDEAAKETRNEYGEKTGIHRVIEVLEGVQWSAPANFSHHDGELDIGGLDIEGDEEAGSFGNMVASNSFPGLDHDLQREMMELSFSLGNQQGTDPEHTHASRDVPEDEDIQVEQLPRLMERILAIREAGSELPKVEKEQFAQREVARIMREMGIATPSEDD